jgi:pSer/pThr/pTyr-binding forkhead associated (FHA) protein
VEESFSKLLEDTIPRQETEGARLTVMNGPEDGRVHLVSRDAAIIGRAESSDVPVLLDLSVSRRHALVIKEGPDYFVEDTGSRYGTRLDGQPLAARQKLRDGAMIRVGETDFCFRVSGSPRQV